MVTKRNPDIDPADWRHSKVEAPSGKSDFPHLTLTDAAGVHQGENVLAVGNPGDAMLFSVTKGIVSAVVIKVRGHTDWMPSITVQKDSEVTLQPEFP